MDGRATASGDAGDIVVTARRREETLSRVPISVAAFSQQTLDRKGIRDVTDLTRFTTGVNFVQNSPVRGFSIAIRGVDSRVGAGTVGVYIDDTPIQVRRIGSFATNVYPQIFDLERVEVLRGPQGTLFGAGSQGGTVRFITPQPDGRFGIYSRAEVSNTDRGGLSYEAGVAAGASLVENVLAFRASMYYRRDGGWIDRVNPDTLALVERDTNRSDTFAIRAALGWRIGETVTITPSIQYQLRDVNNSNQFWNVRSAVPGTFGVPQPAALFTQPFSDRENNRFLNGDPLAQPGTEKFVLAGVKGEAEFGNVTAIGNVSYFDSDSDFKFDFSTPVASVTTRGAVLRVPGFTSFNDQIDRQKNWTAELRLQPTEQNERFNWIVGVFYSFQKQFAFGGISGANNDFLFRSLTGNPNVTADAILGQPNAQPGDYALVAQTNSEDEQFAGFGEVSYNITPELKVTAGARVSHATVKIANLRDGPFSGPRDFFESENSSTPITPKFNIAYQPDQNNLFYATAAKGFRVGGGNGQLPAALCGADVAAIGLTRTPDNFDPDTLWSYEVGSKNKLFGNRLTVDGSAYLIKWDDLQQQVFLPCQFFYVTNAGKARSQGFDLQLSLQATSNLVLGGSVGYIDSKYTETVFPGPTRGTGPNSVIVSDGDVIDNPPWTVVLNGRYDLPVSDGRAYLNADYVYRSRNNGQSPVQNPASVAFEGYPTIESSEQLNLRLGYTTRGWDVSVFMNNVTDEAPLVYYRQDFRGVPLFKNGSVRPRTLGLTVSLRQ